MAGSEKGGTAGAGGATGGSANGGTGDQGGSAGDPGGAGTGGSSDGCIIGNQRCGGETSKTPEVCDEERNWVVNDAVNGGVDCPVLCEGGACTECEVGERTCQGKKPQSCVGGVWHDEMICQHYCRNGGCENPPSCKSTGACGTEGASCCSAIEVPRGSFIRDYDGVTYTNMRYQATLSAFLLDEFEVTVRRFREFVDAYPGSRPSEKGQGAAPHIKPPDPGWQLQYPLPKTREALKAQLNCPGSTWTDVASGTGQLPMNCVDFFVAYAFCIWDGGRLPTEAEWNRAAAGGNQQRVYPWSVPAEATAITPADAVYGLTAPLPPAVGSRQPLGEGLWGHADLAGSLYEWTLDLYWDPYVVDLCDNCLSTTGMNVNGSGYRSIRGGSFAHAEAQLRVSSRLSQKEDEPQNYVGFRCARDIESTN